MTDRRIASANEILAAVLLAGVALTWALAARSATPEGLAWTLNRLAGVAAYVLLALSVSLGAVLQSRFVPAWLARPLQYGWHGLLSGFGLALTAVHVAFVTVDTQKPQTLAAVLVPGRATYAPFALALGTLAAYAALAVYLSFAAKSRLARPLWTGLHLLAYPAFVLATVHGWLAGSDHLTAMYLAGTALAGFATMLRLAEGRGRRSVSRA
ncbi:MAG: ferric reductase [Deinococcales bacterium]|jgi:sulfoxide reductase heme-binding subunit YedZ